MKRHWCYEIPVRPCKDSDAGIGFYVILNDDFYGKFAIGFFFGEYVVSYRSRLGFDFSRGFATDRGG